MVYQILNIKYDSCVNLSLEHMRNTRTRGHELKLVNRRCHYNLRKYSFTVGVMNAWNSVPELVILIRVVKTARFF